MELYYSIILFIFGSVLGSFYNVVGYRVTKKESLLFPSSHCTSCNHKLGVLDLVPIFSYIFLRGKCRYCKEKISLFYPIIEFLTAIGFMFSYITYGFSLKMLLSIVFISMLVIVIVSDYLTMTIPDIILIVFSILILIVKILLVKEKIWISILEAIGSFIFMFLLKLLGDKLFKRESLGGGDIKLLGVFGLTIGFPLSIVSLFLSAFIALPYALITLKNNKSHEIPFGPFLSIAAGIIILLGIDFNSIINLITL